jgi:tRNA threonylcarbamoyladenosine biosynthesis protein TsaE
MEAPMAPLLVRRPSLRRLGRALGAAALPGDVIALVGDLGAGKTHLAQAIARGAGVPPGVRVASPTFAVVIEHAGRIPVHHADLYRLGDLDELAEIGLVERAADGLLLVEWADRLPGALPRDALTITLRPARRGERALTMASDGPRSDALQGVAAAWEAARRAHRGLA